MTTDDAIKEILSSMSSYPDVHEFRIYDYGVIALKYGEKGYAEFDTGIKMLEWLEKTYRDENGNLKGNATT